LRLPTVSDKNGEKNNNNAVNADRNKSMDDTLEADDHSPDGFDEGDEFAMMDEEEEPIDEMAAEQDRKRRKSDSGNSSIGTVSSSTSAAVALDMRVGREKKEVAKPEEDGQTNPNYLSVPKPKRYRRSKAAIKMDQEKTACMICGDKASGCHYSVISCEGCKAFFRRSISRNVVYECKYNNECYNIMDAWLRRKCQCCRLNKCISEGMKEEFVLNDIQREVRKKPRPRRKKNAAENNNNNNADSKDGVLKGESDSLIRSETKSDAGSSPRVKREGGLDADDIDDDADIDVDDTDDQERRLARGMNADDDEDVTNPDVKPFPAAASKKKRKASGMEGNGDDDQRNSAQSQPGDEKHDSQDESSLPQDPSTKSINDGKNSIQTKGKRPGESPKKRAGTSRDEKKTALSKIVCHRSRNHRAFIKVS